MLINLEEMKEQNSIQGRMLPLQVIYKPHLNGQMRIDNVPHLRRIRKNKGNRHDNDYISCDVLSNLATIYKYMEEHHLTEMDYGQFVSIRNFENQHSEGNKKRSFEANHQKEVIHYVKTEWLEKYHEWQLKSNSINAEVSKIAREKIEYLQEKMKQLPQLHQDIIKLKYLQVNESGRFPLDDFIYPKLHISRAYYYIQKKEALYLLGLTLIQENE